jgi:2-phospho-L-lactate guanylyltransferase
MPEDVAALIDEGGGREGITICATRDGGTGALLLTPPDVIRPSFGSNSFERHVALGLKQGIPVREVSIDGFESDLDRLDDLHLLKSPRKQ